MTEIDPGHRDTTRAELAPGRRVTDPGRRSRLLEKLLTGVVVFAFVCGPMAVIPDSVTAQPCPQQQCPPPDDPPDNPPDNPPDDGGGDATANGSGGGGGGGQKNDGGQDGGRHGRDEGRPELTALAGSSESTGQDASVISAPTNQQPLPMIMNAPSPSPDIAGPVLDTPLPPPLTDEPVIAPPAPQWPLPGDPPPGHSELMEDLPLPDHSETVAAVEEQIAETFAPLDSPGSDPVETLPAAQPAPLTTALPSSIISHILNSLSLPLLSPGPGAPAPSILYEFIAFIHKEIQKEIALLQNLIRSALPRP